LKKGLQINEKINKLGIQLDPFWIFLKSIGIGKHETCFVKAKARLILSSNNHLLVVFKKLLYITL